MRRMIFALGGGVLVMGTFFFGTLSILDHLEIRSRDALRAEHAKTVKSALELYRKARGRYPAPFSDNPLIDLKGDLVNGGFISALPQDPLANPLTDTGYRYVSSIDGMRYGLLFHLELTPAGKCITGIGTSETGWWGQPPPCPF